MVTPPKAHTPSPSPTTTSTQIHVVPPATAQSRTPPPGERGLASSTDEVAQQQPNVHLVGYTAVHSPYPPVSKSPGPPVALVTTNVPLSSAPLVSAHVPLTSAPLVSAPSTNAPLTSMPVTAIPVTSVTYSRAPHAQGQPRPHSLSSAHPTLDTSGTQRYLQSSSTLPAMASAAANISSIVAPPHPLPPPPHFPINHLTSMPQQQREYQAAMELEMWKMTQEQVFMQQLK